jgi:cytochrome P450
MSFSFYRVRSPMRNSGGNKFFWTYPMQRQQDAIIPPAPIPHAKDLSTPRLMLTSIRNTLDIWPDYTFEVPFNRRTVLGVEAVLLNDPAAIQQVMITQASNYVRPVLMPRILRPLLGRGIFLAEGDEWRHQRRLLSPTFTPHSVGQLLPHFAAVAKDLARNVEAAAPLVDLSGVFQTTTLEAVLRALFSMPDSGQRDNIGGLVRAFVNGPGRPRLLDNFAPTETSLAWDLRKRRDFQKVWSAAIDAVVAERRQAPPQVAHRDLLDMLLAVRDPQTGEALAPNQVRDQCATMIFGAYETTARLLFWTTYLLTLDGAEQERLRAEVLAFPPDRVSTMADLAQWSRLRLVLLEVLRLYPPVPHLVREPVADDTILGEPVRAGIQVWISPWVLHRHRTHWAHPTAFMPDRFAGKSSPWTSIGAYVPFGAGPRICLGAVFAMAEAQIIMATLLTRFRIGLDEAAPVMPIGRLTIEPSRCPKFRVEPV